MARIRSLHPAWFTDEVFVALPLEARLFWLGLLVEADDGGIFRWQPATLKMRILPMEAGAEPHAMLEALEQAGIIHRFHLDGAEYGAIRNFRRFQRPQKPTTRYPQPEYLLGFLRDGTAAPAPAKPCSDTAIKPLLDVSGTPLTGEEGKGEEKEGKEVQEGQSAASAPPSPATAGDLPNVDDEKPDLPLAVQAGLFDLGQPIAKVARVKPAHHLGKDVLRELAGVWNATAAEVDLPQVSDLTDARAEKLRKVMAGVFDNDPDRWRDYVGRIAATPFLRGESGRGWKADFGWAITPENALKVLEGKYDSRGTS